MKTTVNFFRTLLLAVLTLTFGACGEDRLLRKVVKGMLPKNKLGAKLLGNMYVYAGSEHKHQAQNPKMIDINALK